MLAYRNLKSFRQEARFSTWLYRIATNAFLADARKRRKTCSATGRGGRRRRRGRRSAFRCRGTGTRARGDAEDGHGSGARRAVESERAAIVQCYHNTSRTKRRRGLNCPVAP